jgi:hypothetical protein
MAVLSTFRAPSLCRHVHRELLRIVLLDVTPIIAATACHQRNYVERYSRCSSPDHFIRLEQDGGRNRQTERLGGLEVDDQLKLGGLLDG